MQVHKHGNNHIELKVFKRLHSIVVVKKTFRYSNVFFYNRTPAYAAIPQFGTLLWKTV
jgi:hypothetical protein